MLLRMALPSHYYDPLTSWLNDRNRDCAAESAGMVIRDSFMVVPVGLPWPRDRHRLGVGGRTPCFRNRAAPRPRRSASHLGLKVMDVRWRIPPRRRVIQNA